MENLENNVVAENSTMSNDQINECLMETSKWGKFLAILGYVLMGFLVLLALVTIVGFSFMAKAAGKGVPTFWIGLVYIVFAGIYYIPITYLYRFSVQMKQALQTNDENLYASGFQNLKSLFKFTGIFTIVILSLYALIIVIALPIALLLK
jgi:hypothetical protein